LKAKPESSNGLRNQKPAAEVNTRADRLPATVG